MAVPSGHLRVSGKVTWLTMPIEHIFEAVPLIALPEESTTWKVKANVPGEVGVPVIASEVPVILAGSVGLKFSPPGSEPDRRLKV